MPCVEADPAAVPSETVSLSTPTFSEHFLNQEPSGWYPVIINSSNNMYPRLHRKLYVFYIEQQYNYSSDIRIQVVVQPAINNK